MDLMSKALFDPADGWFLPELARKSVCQVLFDPTNRWFLPELARNSVGQALFNPSNGWFLPELARNSFRQAPSPFDPDQFPTENSGSGGTRGPRRTRMLQRCERLRLSGNHRSNPVRDDLVVRKGAWRRSARKLPTGAVDEVRFGLCGGPRQGPPQSRIFKEQRLPVIIHSFRFVSRAGGEVFSAAEWPAVGAVAASAFPASLSVSGKKRECATKNRGCFDSVSRTWGGTSAKNRRNVLARNKLRFSSSISHAIG